MMVFPFISQFQPSNRKIQVKQTVKHVVVGDLRRVISLMQVPTKITCSAESSWSGSDSSLQTLNGRPKITLLQLKTGPSKWKMLLLLTWMGYWDLVNNMAVVFFKEAKNPDPLLLIDWYSRPRERNAKVLNFNCILSQSTILSYPVNIGIISSKKPWNIIEFSLKKKARTHALTACWTDISQDLIKPIYTEVIFRPKALISWRLAPHCLALRVGGDKFRLSGHSGRRINAHDSYYERLAQGCSRDALFNFYSQGGNEGSQMAMLKVITSTFHLCVCKVTSQTLLSYRSYRQRHYRKAMSD